MTFSMLFENNIRSPGRASVQCAPSVQFSQPRTDPAWTSVHTQQYTHRFPAIACAAWLSSTQALLDPSSSRGCIPQAISTVPNLTNFIPSTINASVKNQGSGRAGVGALNSASRPQLEPNVPRQSPSQLTSRDPAPGNLRIAASDHKVSTASTRERRNARTDGAGSGGSKGARSGTVRAADNAHINTTIKRTSGASQPPTARQPQPPPPPDHSSGGYTLISSPPELELMLDQLAAAATVAAAGQSASSHSGADGPGRGTGSSSVLLGSGGGVGPLAVDCEGVELGRPGGRLCLIQLSARCGGGAGRGSSGISAGGGRSGVSIWLVDVAAMGWRAFQYRSRVDGATSLKSLMEDPAVIKYLYDVRRDAVALSSEYGIRLRGVVDLQLADVAVRQAEGGLRAGGWVEGLVSALSRGLAAGGRASAPARLAEDLAAATATSRRYHEGNNTQVWSQRPLSEELCGYAATDVRYLHALAEALSPRISKELAEKVVQESFRRTVNTMMTNNKEVRAAAPVMIARQPPSPTSEEAAGATMRGYGERSSGRSAGSTLGGGGVGRDINAPYMGLMEWLTAALLLRYDRCGLAAAAAVKERQLPPLPSAAAAQTTVKETPQQQQQQQPVAAAAAEVARLRLVKLSRVGVATSSAGDPSAAALLQSQRPTVPPKSPAWSSLPTQPSPSASPSPLSSPTSPSTSGLSDTEAAIMAVAAAAAAGDGQAPVVLPPDGRDAVGRAIAPTNLTGSEARTVMESTSQPKPKPLLSSMSTSPPSSSPSCRPSSAAEAEAEAAEGTVSLREVPTSVSFGVSGEDSITRSTGHDLKDGGSRHQQQQQQHELLHQPSEAPTSRPLYRSSVEHQQQQQQQPAPLLVPSVESLMRAEQTLSQLWLDLRTKYDNVEPEEERKLARLAAQWLLASQKGLMGLAVGSLGPGASAGRIGIGGRGDPGLRFLLE